MNVGQSAVLGIVQGLTEFIPVSSTAHLRIIPAFFGWEDPGAPFTAVCQLGTMAAVLLYFRDDLWRITKAFVRRDGSHDALMGWYIGLGTIPIAVFGLAFSHKIESGARNLKIIGVALIALGLVLLAAERFSKRTRDLQSFSARDAAAIGVAQAAALVPGVSRSGSTITAGLFLGLTREAAARYSFLLSIPAVVLSGFAELPKIKDGDTGAGACIVSIVLAFIVGYASIAWLLKLMQTTSTLMFVVYRVLMGSTVLILVATNAIN